MMQESKTTPLPFGDPTRYYSGEHESQDNQASLFEFARVDREVQAVLQSRHEDFHERVHRTVKSWNEPVRNWIRDETRLGGAARQPVAVHVVDGLPRPFSRAFHDISNSLLWELILNNATLKTTLTGLDILSGNFSSIAEQIEELAGSSITREQVLNTQTVTESVIKWINEQAITERLKDINEDVLGAYFFRERKIRIYWMAIGLVARMLDVSLEGLTITVLAHELVHAYSHVGIDADKEQWDTEVFALTDLRIVEGLAQFYTATVCNRVEDRAPGTVEAFETLLKHQSEAYTLFQSWTQSRERAGEIIRSAMVHARKRKLVQYQDFLDEIGRVRERMGRSTRKVI
jgi:hypothetical protein